MWKDGQFDKWILDNKLSLLGKKINSTFTLKCMQKLMFDELKLEIRTYEMLKSLEHNIDLYFFWSYSRKLNVKKDIEELTIHIKKFDYI